MPRNMYIERSEMTVKNEYINKQSCYRTEQVIYALRRLTVQFGQMNQKYGLIIDEEIIILYKHYEQKMKEIQKTS
ncbi:MAG TPA: hypothetical protein VK029_08835 [Pseudogracilibacillus sp.]|nr:hypothetical protein [Pseudogracilibacillus sp.]